MAQIKTSHFASSHARVSQTPQDGRPEFAFIGRSNVGKSSLINMLAQRKELAHTSGKPGKTQLLNYYLINYSWYLTDLPGYGYAKQSKKTRGKWESRTENYFLKRQSLVSAFVLIDSNIPPQAIDLEFVNWLGEHGVPFVLAFTKTDRKASRDGGSVEDFCERMLEVWEELPPVFRTSATRETGRDDILEYMESALNTVHWPFYGEAPAS